jgi:hypothetical protein
MEKYYTIASADFIWNLADGLFLLLGNILVKAVLSSMTELSTMQQIRKPFKYLTTS